MILHGDLDAFYAAVAQRDEPSLRGKPLVVAGSSRRAVVLTPSYEARPYGIHSAMPLYQAKARCPHLIVAPPAYEKYREASRSLFAILRSHSRTVEGLSLDEAFCDLGDVSLADGVEVGRRIKRDVRETMALTISIGLATAKMVAKVASDDGKPDGLVAVAPSTEAEYLKEKPLRRLWGVGPKTEERLRARGLERIGQIAELIDETLRDLFGGFGIRVRELSLGIDRRTVSPADAVRSISSEETFERDVAAVDQLRPFVRAQACELAERLKHRSLRASTVAVKIKLSDFSIISRQTSLAQPTDDARLINAAATFCLRRADPQRPVRLIGVRVGSLAAAGIRQIGLFAPGREIER
ncbi:MAG: DNA polymerase IV [Candidatus Eremiobacteraeota bacterium]|nr:DNA polymerase IV [Candidatus Eremiobacteraeota bacterium]